MCRLTEAASKFTASLWDLVGELKSIREKGCHGSHSNLATKQDLKETERKIMLSQAELTAGLLQIKTQVAKVAQEQSTRFDTLTAKIAELQAIIAAGGTIGPEVEAALQEVKTALQALDDTIPDAPTPPAV